jgi:hypothetical protein
MIISAQPVHSFHVTRVTGMQSPVRLTHPQGESFQNQSDGLWLRAYTAGGPRCDACRTKDAFDAQARAERAAADAAGRVAQAQRNLPGASDPNEVIGLLVAAAEGLDAATARSAWTKLAASGALPSANAEVVHVKFRKPRLGAPDVSEQWRRLAWLDEEGGRVWLDAQGKAWIAKVVSRGLGSSAVPTDRVDESEYFHVGTGKRLVGQDPNFFTATFAIPAGQPVRMVREIEKRSPYSGSGGVRDVRLPYWRLEGGIRLTEATGTNVTKLMVRFVSVRE